MASLSAPTSWMKMLFLSLSLALGVREIEMEIRRFVSCLSRAERSEWNHSTMPDGLENRGKGCNSDFPGSMVASQYIARLKLMKGGPLTHRREGPSKTWFILRCRFKGLESEERPHSVSLRTV